MPSTVYVFTARYYIASPSSHYTTYALLIRLFHVEFSVEIILHYRNHLLRPDTYNTPRWLADGWLAGQLSGSSRTIYATSPISIRTFNQILLLYRVQWRPQYCTLACMLSSWLGLYAWIPCTCPCMARPIACFIIICIGLINGELKFKIKIRKCSNINNHNNTTVSYSKHCKNKLSTQSTNQSIEFVLEIRKKKP